MVTSDRGKTAAKVGVGVTAGALAAFLLGRKAKAAPVPTLPQLQMVSLDDPTMQALLSILEHAESLDLDVDAVLRHLADIAAGINRLSTALGVGGVVKLENPPDITAFTVLTTVLNTPVQFPYREIPYDKELVIKAMPTNLGIVLVAPSRSDAMNLNSSYWLVASEVVQYKIKNAEHIWLNVPPVLGIAGEGVVCTVEQESR